MNLKILIIRYCIAFLLAISIILFISFDGCEPGESDPKFIREDWAKIRLSDYVIAQELYFKKDIDGDGIHNYADTFVKLTAVKKESCESFLSKDFVAATSKSAALWGYYFVNINDWSEKRDGHGLCAVPEEYDVTGCKVFIVDHRGCIYSRDFSKSVKITSWPWPSDLKKWKFEERVKIPEAAH